jgi:hypothetical protein
MIVTRARISANPVKIGKQFCLTVAMIGAALTSGFAGRAMAGTPNQPEPARIVHSYDASFSSKALQLSVRPGPDETTVMIVNQPSKAPRSVILPNPVRQVVSFQALARGRILITSEMAEPAMEVAIFDVKSGKIVDDIWCYEPVLSPDHRYIAFERFYPERGVDMVQASSFGMIYDTALSPRANTDPGQLMADPTTRGRLVYPSSYDLPYARGVHLQITHAFVGPVSWSADSRTTLLIDRVSPGDILSQGAARDGNLMASPRIPPNVVARLVRVDLEPGRVIRTQADTGLCDGQLGAGCNINLPSIKLTSDSIVIDVGKKISVPLSALHPVSARR